MPRTFPRRDFMAAAVASPLVAATPDGPGYIDAHVHMWTPDTKAYPLAMGYSKADMQPPSFTPEELFAHCAPAGVAKVVLIQMSFYGTDNRYMLDTMARHKGKFAGVAVVDRQAADLADTVKRLAGQGVRGYRIHPDKTASAKDWLSDAGMAKLWKLAAKHNQAICPLINPEDLPAVETLARKFPETRVVIDHFARIGGSGTIDEAALARLCGMAKLPQVHVKLSAYYAFGKKTAPYRDLEPMIRKLHETFGAGRLMWASDCPYQVQGKHAYADSIDLIRRHCGFLSADDRRAILRDTAERVFF